MTIEATKFIKAQDVAAAIATYNSIRTSLEDAGWKPRHEDKDLDDTYWWIHPNHPGTFSMPAAFRQLALDWEKEKERASNANVQTQSQTDGSSPSQP